MRRLSLWGAATLGTLTLPWLAWADMAGEGANGHGHMWGGGWAHWIFGPVMMILFIAVIVAVVVLVVRWLGGTGDAGGGAGARPKAAQDILEERFARGEIDKEEFEQRRQALRD